jgi:hypothetical protein
MSFPRKSLQSLPAEAGGGRESKNQGGRWPLSPISKDVYMKEEANWIWNACIYARKQFYKINGLIVSLIVPCFLFPVLANIFKGFDDLNCSNLSFLQTGHFYLILYVIISLIIILIWFVKRAVPKTRKGKIGILFGPAHVDAIRTELEDLFRKLRGEIESKDFLKIISIKTLPPNIEVGEHSKNLEILTKANAAVLICGNFETFTAEGKHITGFSSFTISARLLPATPQYAPVLLGDAIFGRQLSWTAENTIHKNVVVNNLSEMARYIVGLSLIANAKYDNAQAILHPLFIEIKQKYNHKRLPIEIIRFKNTIQKAYVVSLVKGVVEQYNKELTDENIFSLNIQTVQRWKDTLNRAIDIDNQDYNGYLSLAIINFLSNDVSGAKESIRRARQYIPFQGQNLCDISEAFLLCFEGNLRVARKLYKKLTKNPPTYHTINSVCSFLNQAIGAFKDKPQIRFVYALLNDEYGDKSIASCEFNKFISEVEGNEFYEKWKREASLRIKRLEQLSESNVTSEISDD